MQQAAHPLRNPRLWGWVGIPVLLFALNLALKWPTIDAVQIGLDEPFTIFHAQLPPGQILDEFAYSNSPPMLELILHAWMQWFGDSVAAVRFPSMLFSCMTAVLLFWLGWRVRSMETGVVAALLFTLSTWMTYFGHEARIYAGFGMLTVASLRCLLWLRDAPRSWLRTAVFALVTLLLVFSHYFGLIVVAWECLWVLLVPHPARRVLVMRVGLAIGLLAVALLPGLTKLLSTMEETAGHHWVGLSSLAGAYSTLAKYLNQPVVAVATLALLAWAGARWIVLWRQGRAGVDHEVLLVLGVFPGGFLLVWGLGLFVPMFLDRYLIFSMVGLYLVMALGMGFVLPKRWQQGLLAALFLILMGATTDLTRDNGSAWREVAAKVRARYAPGDAVLVYPDYSHLAFMYFFDPALFRDHAHFKTRSHTMRLMGIKRHTPLSQLNLVGANRVWVILTGVEKAEFSPSVDSLLRADYVPGPAVEGNRQIGIVGYVRANPVSGE
jgi:4-amino-4-deoxy-L-arabinose transferase-like glycosyltransferase